MLELMPYSELKCNNLNIVKCLKITHLRHGVQTGFVTQARTHTDM